MHAADILLSEEAPESDYEYVNPVHVILIDDDKDEVASSRSSSSSPPNSWNGDDNCNAWRSKQSSTPTRSPSAVNVKTKPVSLPPMPTKKRFRPPVPPRKQPSVGNGLRRHLDRDGYLGSVDEDEDSLSEPTVPVNAQDSCGNSSHWQPFNRCRRANSVDSLLNWQPVASSPSDSESEIGFRPITTKPPSIRNNRRLMSLKFRGDLGLVPTNIASLSVEEVGLNIYIIAVLLRQKLPKLPKWNSNNN